jgi:hypothetical protein
MSDTYINGAEQMVGKFWQWGAMQRPTRSRAEVTQEKASTDSLRRAQQQRRIKVDGRKFYYY